MKYLLDTHTAIWAFTDLIRLSGKAKTDELTLITADENIQKYDVPTLW
jgi:PIN domain nuclease of toxin-antitoxin system